MAKAKEIREVRSVGILSLLLLVAACLFVWSPAWNGQVADTQLRTLHRAESLAYQLLESRRQASRGPASAPEVELNQLVSEEGHIGVDPWGRPYNFKLLKTKENQKSKILVWSLGPNGTSETSNQTLESNRDNETPTFEGDDLGIMVSIK